MKLTIKAKRKLEEVGLVLYFSLWVISFLLVLFGSD